jgi:HD-GYP domain-containing protein (c-di-GMP phosphodiesterase class II)
MKNLIERVEKTFDRVDAHPDAKEKFIPLLQTLGNKDLDTLNHSVRVAYLGRRIAEYTHLIPPKTLWLPGLLHDIGKIVIDPRTLTKKEGFDERDMEQMKAHVEYGCKILLGIADFSAFALFYHHFFKTKGAYPTQEDFDRIFNGRFDSWTEGERTLAKYCGRLIAIADFYDAATTRKNNKHTKGNEVRSLDRDECKELLIKENRDQEYLIRKLYEKKIFK